MGNQYDRKAIIDHNKENFNFFASFCLPDVVTYRFPAFYENLSLLLIQELMRLGGEKVVMRLALSLPRGHAKTTFIKLFVVYGIIHDLFTFVIIICANEDRARDFLSDVHDILLSHNIKAVYDNWELQLKENNKDTKRGDFLGRRIILQAVGAGTSFRGIVKDNKRPDLILFDDAQSEKNAESLIESSRLLKWVTGTAIKTKSPKRCLVIWIGNMYDPPENCILYHLANSPQWTSLVTGGILAGGEALWPELHPAGALLEEYLNDVSLGQGASWFAEIQNDPMAAPNRLLPDGDFPLTILGPEHEPVGAFITIDPAGSKRTSDDNVVAGHIIYHGGQTEVRELVAKVMNPEETIGIAVDMAQRLGAPAIFPESNAYQETLAFWMNKYLAMTGLESSISVFPVHSSAAKLGRIREYIKQLLAGSAIITDLQVKAHVLYQALSFNVLKTDNKDDILDCCAMGERVKSEHINMCLFPNGVPLYSSLNGHNFARVRRGAHPLAKIRSQRYTH